MNIRQAPLLLTAALLGYCASVLAAADGSQLELPAGATVAIVVFEDLQCPDCARSHAGIVEAAQTNDVPLVIHDYPIRRHKWAFDAAVYGRYFKSLSPSLVDEYRTYIYANQPDITPETLRGVVEKFAREHAVELPADVDPDGKFRASVQADFDLGTKIQLEYVPLIFVIGTGSGAAHFVEVHDPERLGDAIAKMRESSAH